MPVDAGLCYPNDKVCIPVTTGFSRGLVGYWGALVVAGLLLMQHEVFDGRRIRADQVAEVEQRHII